MGVTLPYQCCPQQHILIFGISRRDVADGLQQPAMVESVDPFACGVFDGFKAALQPVAVDHLSHLEAVNRLG